MLLVFTLISIFAFYRLAHVGEIFGHDPNVNPTRKSTWLALVVAGRKLLMG